MVNVVFMGIQGSGKGTQAKRLSKRLGITHINVGNLLRRNIAENTRLGQIAKKYTVNGDLVPDKYIIELIKEQISLNKHGVVLDGFPRTMEQAKYLSENVQIDHVFQFVLSDQKSYDRITSRRICENCKEDFNILHKSTKGIDVCDKCGGRLVRRNDDNDDAIKSRIAAYHSLTEPTINFFEVKGMLVKIDAEMQPELIHIKVLEIIDNAKQ